MHAPVLLRAADDVEVEDAFWVLETVWVLVTANDRPGEDEEATTELDICKELLIGEALNVELVAESVG